VHGYLVGEDAPVAKKRGPLAASPVGMEAVDHDHARHPEGEILELGGCDATHRSVSS